VGECLVEARPSNTEGHFEDVEFLKIHEEILASNNVNLAGLIHHKELDISVYQLAKLKSVIDIKDQRYKQWGWKEPRTCLFLDVYQELIPGSKYLVILRDYPSVTTSLLKRDFAEVEKIQLRRKLFKRLLWKYFRRDRKQSKFYRENAGHFLKVWIEYNEHILNLLKGLQADDYAVINYSVLQKNDRQIFSFLTKTWGFMLQYFPFNEVYKENLMGRPIDLTLYIKDASLLMKAEQIQREFKKYMKAY
jgi:hypothetical protein